MVYSEIVDLLLDNVKKIIFPEEWIKIDLTLSKHELFTLMLVERKGEISMSRIAEYVNVSMSTATGIVDRLVKNGFLVRNRTETDRRIVMISLTKKAEKVIEEIKSIGTRYISLVGDALTAEERAFIYSIFMKIISVINNDQQITEKSDNSEKLQRVVIE
jgi:DNA-binding MarR family transcriptional regulator